MKKFKKGLLPVLALGAAMVMVVSCGPTGGAGYQEWNPEMSPRELKAEITWWNNYQQPGDKDVTEDDLAEYNFIQGVIKEFNKIYPNVTVKTENRGGYGEILDAVTKGLSGGNVPNMASCYGDHVAVYDAAGATLAMDGFTTDKTIGFGKSVDQTGKVIDDATTALNDFNQSYLNGEKNMYGSKKLLSMPYSKSTETLVVNQDVFDKDGAGECGVTATGEHAKYKAPVAGESKKPYSIPTTWDELIATARKMKEDFPNLFGEPGTVKVDEQGYFTAIPFVYDSAENMIISFLTMAGIDYTDASGKNVDEQILFGNDTRIKDLLVQLKKWENEGLICTQDQLTVDARGYHAYSSDLVAQGNVFMCISSTAGARYFSTDGLEVTLNATPTFTLDSLDGVAANADTSKHRVIAQGPSITFFDKADINENYASWLFYKFLTNTENAAHLAVATSYLPVRESSYDTDEVKALLDAAAAKDTLTNASDYNVKNNTYSGTALELDAVYTEGDDYIITDVFNRSSATRTAIGDMIQAIFDDKEAKTDDQIKTLVETELNDAVRIAKGA